MRKQSGAQSKHPGVEDPAALIAVFVWRHQIGDTGRTDVARDFDLEPSSGTVPRSGSGLDG